MKIHVSELSVGDIVLTDIFNSYGLHVLSKGTCLNEQDISKLYNHQIEYVDIEPRSKESFLTEFDELSQEAFHRIKPYYDQAVDGYGEIFHETARSGTIDKKAVQEMVTPLTQHIKQQSDVVNLLLMLNNKDDYTYQHSIEVGMLSYYIAVWTGYKEEEALIIGNAGFLHDIGKCRIDSDILNKTEALTKEEAEEVAKHTIYGYELIRNSLYQYSIATAALQHHERANASGYPFGMPGDKIHPYAKIVAIANEYSTMISARNSQAQRDLLTVLHELHRLSFTELDPTATHTFIAHMIPNFIGKKVVLQTGDVGKIIMTNKDDFFRPLIQIDDRFIDLSTERDLVIKDIYL
ncbi:hypothetical protein PAE9249_00241 [Paenibacillus sp. CECT 9249]|uniref:HD-GYP domain-containing protein n=1 Tax=Paenibacillus sp. CECT 9249 TaxID=2845385 RepID=UPI001E3249C4|nr:HD domain-containing phosphohydrolase [Paenibacillus sp. CECT 9249]CAH0117780.1 hypothetical protein PAE9249_00241 [Paenibacillus sp. CECT 9249]